MESKLDVTNVQPATARDIQTRATKTMTKILENCNINHVVNKRTYMDCFVYIYAKNIKLTFLLKYVQHLFLPRLNMQQ